jgi:hypothetical protein
MSNFYKLILFSLLTVSGVGCVVKIPYDYRVLDSGHYWPKNDKWTVRPEANQLHYIDKALDFNAVYLNTYPPHDESCFTYRFWKNGRMIAKNMRNPPSIEDVDDLRGSYLGYYRIENGYVIVEIYGPVAPPIGRGGYSKRTYDITDEGLLWISKQSTRWNYEDMSNWDKKQRLFVRYPIEGMESEPFW